MTEPDLTPADGDTPGRFATPAQDADVRALLGTLRAEDVPMPDDVVRRINAAVVAERVASTLPDSPAALVDADDALDRGAATAGSATVTVLPTAAERRGPSYAGLTKLLAVAAAVVVVVGVGAIIKNNGGLTTGASTSAGASSAPEDATAGGGDAAVKATGQDYTAESLAGQVRGLVTGTVDVASPAVGQSSGPVAPSSTTSGTRSSAYSLADRNVLAACVTSITGGTSVAPVAVDEGTYGGKPAQVLVLPTEGDPASLDVWVVAPGCGTTPEPTVLTFQRIARP